MKLNSAAFCLTVVLGLGVAFSVRATDLNGEPLTLKAANQTGSYENSSATTSVVTFASASDNVTMSGTLSGNIKVVVNWPSKDRAWTFSQVCSHTGGTELKGIASLGRSGFGTEPIVLKLNGSSGQGGVRLNVKSIVLTNDIVMTGTGDMGYQTTQANCQGKLSNSAYPVTFAGKITARDCGEICFHQGDQCKSQGTQTSGPRMLFNGKIDAAGTDVYLTCVTNSSMCFNNDFTAKRVLCQYYTAACHVGHVYLASGHDFTFDSIDLAGHFMDVNGQLNEDCVLGFTMTINSVGPMAVDAAVNKAVYSWGGAYADPEISKFTFGADQTINCVTGVALTASQAAQPGMVLKGAGKTLTLKCALASAECSARVSDSLSLTLNATDKDNVQAFLSRTNDTTGALNVQKGVFKIGAGASFPNVSSVAVGADGTLAIDTAVENPIPVSTVLALTTGAKVDVAAGASVTVDSVTMDGVQVRKDDLVAAGVLTGAGTFEVTNEPPPFTDGVWTAETSGDWSVTANWENGKVASGAEATATFRTAGTMDEPVVVTVDSERAVGVVEVEAGHVRLVGTQMLDLGGDDLDGALSAVSADASLEVAGAVKAMTEPLTLNSVAADDAASAGRILWNATSFTGGSGVTPRLRTGFGTVAFESFDFLSGNSDLLLGGGTVAYTGAADATIPGFTVGETDGHAAIFSVTNAEATVTMTNGIATSSEVAAADIHGFIKEGKGKLKIFGDSTFNGKNSGYVAANIGVKANGTGPTAGYYSLNVADGTLEIGDADNAPVVTTANGMAVGLRARPATEVQTGGTLVMNSGTLTVNANSMLIGYYSGVYHNGTGTKVTNRFTLNGGLVNVKAGSLYLGYDGSSGMAAGDLSSYADIVCTINGGELDAQALNVGNNKMGNTGHTRIWMTMNGGLVRLSGAFTGGNVQHASRFTFTGNGGRLEANSVNLNKSQTANTSNVDQEYSFNEGFTLRTPTITSDKNRVEVAFDGGVWEQTLENAKYDTITTTYSPKLTTKGIVIALTNDAAKSYSLEILDPFVNEDNKTKGAMTFQGPGFAKFGGDFASSTFTGAFTVKDGATVLSGADHLQNLNVVVAPGGALRTAEECEVMTASLTLGAVGATAPACIQMATNSAIKVTGDLKVLSPVVFKYASSDLPNATLSGATDFDGFTIDAKTISSYDRELFQLDPSDREAGYGLRVQRVSTADGSRLSVKIAKRSCLVGVIR